MHFGFSHYLHICISMTSSSVFSSLLTGLVFRLKLKIRTQLKKSMITSGEPLMLVALIGCDPSIANVFYSRFVILKWKSRFVQANASVCLAKVDYSLPLSLLWWYLLVCSKKGFFISFQMKTETFAGTSFSPFLLLLLFSSPKREIRC